MGWPRPAAPARLVSAEAASTVEIANQENLTRRYVNRLLRLVFLDPAITSAILDGARPVKLTAKNRPAIPLVWGEQRQFLGFDQHRRNPKRNPEKTKQRKTAGDRLKPP